MSRSRTCAVSTSVVSRSVGTTCSGGDRFLTCPAISFAFWPIGCRPIGWVTLISKASGCSMQPALLKTPENPLEIKRQTTEMRPGTMLAREWNGRMQMFNTTTSMGRLTLNVLLSFAQFEREVTSERIRDKIAASKRKGLWVGGMAPLGYDTRDRKITVNEAEAERVQTIFENYLRLGSLNLVMAELRKRGIVTKVRTLKTGETVGGIAFTRGPLAHLLRNRFYTGEVAFKGEVLAGEQPPSSIETCSMRSRPG